MLKNDNGNLSNKIFLSFFFTFFLLFSTINPIIANEAEPNIIKIGGSYDYPPYSFIDEKGEASGFSADISRALAKILAKEVDFQLEAWGDVRSNFENKQTDLIHDIVFSEARDKTYEFTNPYYISYYSVFKKNDAQAINTFEELSEKRIVLVRGDIGHDYIIEQNIPAYIHLVDDYADAILLLEKGDFDYTMMDKLAGLYWIKTLGADKVTLSKVSPFEIKYAYAGLEDNKELLMELDGALAILHESGEYQKIYTSWMSKIDPASFNYEDALKDILIVGIPIVLLFIVWSWTLKQKVREKTEQLNQELDEKILIELELRCSYENIEANLEEITALEENARYQYEKIQESERKLTMLMSNLPGMVFCCKNDENWTMEFVSEGCFELCGYRAEELIGNKTISFNEIIPAKYRDHLRQAWQDKLSKKEKVTLEYEIKCKDGLMKWVWEQGQGVYAENGELLALEGFITDISQRKIFESESRQKQQQIGYLSYHDQLTGLYNRRYFEEELTRLDILENLPISIIIADVNGLKLTNDAFGHAAGDELLQKVAIALNCGCRAQDLIARHGGDEFVIILPKTSKAETEQVVKRIQDLCLKEKVAAMELSISFGWYSKIKADEDILEILKKAEDQMYKKKLFESPSMRGKTISVIIHTLYEKNKREEKHSHRVADLCKRFGEAINLPDGEIQELKTMGLMHDIGKIAIDDKILNKEAKLNELEWEEIKRHPEIGYRILSSVNDLAEMAEYVLAHHERWDGKGYPIGLIGEKIPLQARIICIADAYDAMTRERPYRAALSEELTIAELKSNAGTQFDPLLVEVFINKVLQKRE